MAPRKKSQSTSSISSSVKNVSSQPSKFGIEHFFNRHSQSVSASQKARLEPDPITDSQKQTPPAPDLPLPQVVDDRKESCDTSPIVSNGATVKRFKFSPGALVKQSQDDGGEEVTWKISPVNEKLQAPQKNLSDMMRILTDASKLNASSMRVCSQKKVQNSPASLGKVEKWLSSPPLRAHTNSIKVPKRVSFHEPFSVKEEKRIPCIEDADRENVLCMTAASQSPFRTPPSVLYSSCEYNNGCNGKETSNQLASWQHKKALLELLDQVEDVITVDESHFYGSGADLIKELHEPRDAKVNKEVFTGKNSTVSESGVLSFLSGSHFLVLEVTEKHRDADSPTGKPFKILRVLHEYSGVERQVHLLDEWFSSLIKPGDTINVIGNFDNEGKCIVDRESNMIVTHPDILISGTRVAASFGCPRRAVLDERIKSKGQSDAALMGTLLHQIFQAGLVHDLPTREYLKHCAEAVLRNNVESLYAIGADENDVLLTLFESIPKMLSWICLLRGLKSCEVPTIDFGAKDGLKKVHIIEVMDIEELALSPRYGLKGMIDASVRVRVSPTSNKVKESIMPLEFKTGKRTSGQTALEHQAQVALYTLLMSDRYTDDIHLGLLYYLNMDQTQGIAVKRADLVGLIMRRNEHANDVLKASISQILPPMLKNVKTCEGCRHLNSCAAYHKAHGGDVESSGLGELFALKIDHLSAAHYEFLLHWDRLIDLEQTQVSKGKKWYSNNSRRDLGLSSLVLKISQEVKVTDPPKDRQFIYKFVTQSTCASNLSSGGCLDAMSKAPQSSKIGSALKRGDMVMLSTESGHVAVASGIIVEIDSYHVSVSLSHRLRIPGSCFASEVDELRREVWQIDKDDNSSSYGTMRSNLVQLFGQSAESAHLRKIVVDLEVPRFESGVIFSQDPAVSYIKSERSLNDDQRRAILKILAAKDYTLILGMPGTGKTSTLVHAVKALLMRGASILLTSYTNSAVDNLLIKLKYQGIDFVRIGRNQAIHDEIQEYCLSANIRSVKVLKQKLDQTRVVGVTCLGVTHPLLTGKKFDICIMDEAGQITLPVSLGPLMLASKFVLVGDHYQLPPLVQSTEAKENGMEVSLFCRLSEAHPHAISALQSQYRMCAEIMELSNTLIYGNRLRCGSVEVATARINVSTAVPYSSWVSKALDPKRAVIFINTDTLPGIEVKKNSTINNPIEAYILSELTIRLLEGGISGDEIGIITPYNAQVSVIQNFLPACSVEVHTIDKYQGRDKDCIMVSFVRSTENRRACASSLIGDWHRINVAITRAKKKLILVGSSKTLSRVPLLKLLIEKVDDLGGMMSISRDDLQLSDIRRFSQYSLLVLLLILVELGCAAFVFFDHSWQDVIPTDSTGDYTMMYDFIKKHWKIAKWVALGAVILEALAFLLALVVRAANSPPDYDTDDEYIAPRSGIRKPLIDRQPVPVTGVPVPFVPDHRDGRYDAWSTRMTEKYGLDTAEFTYNPLESNRYQQQISPPAEERSRCNIM